MAGCGRVRYKEAAWIRYASKGSDYKEEDAEVESHQQCSEPVFPESGMLILMHGEDS